MIKEEACEEDERLDLIHKLHECEEQKEKLVREIKVLREGIMYDVD